MDSFDREVVKHMLLWGPYGTLYDEDVFPTFGLTAAQFNRRFAEVVQRLGDPRDGDERTLFDDARRYLAQYQGGR